MPPESVMQVLVRRVGFIRAGKVLSFVMAWTVADAELGLASVELEASSPEIASAAARIAWDGRPRSLTVEQYAKFWKLPRSKAYREQQWFREAFEPEGFRTPDDLLDAIAPNRSDVGAGIALAPMPS